jgi:hypothetical protein
LSPSKTWHYPSYSTLTGTKKEGNKAETPNPTNKLFQQTLFKGLDSFKLLICYNQSRRAKITISILGGLSAF